MNELQFFNYISTEKEKNIIMVLNDFNSFLVDLSKRTSNSLLNNEIDLKDIENFKSEIIKIIDNALYNK